MLLGPAQYLKFSFPVPGINRLKCKSGPIKLMHYYFEILTYLPIYDQGKNILEFNLYQSFKILFLRLLINNRHISKNIKSAKNNLNQNTLDFIVIKLLKD